jgi:hypothetical protein
MAFSRRKSPGNPDSPRPTPQPRSADILPI